MYNKIPEMPNLMWFNIYIFSHFLSRSSFFIWFCHFFSFFVKCSTASWISFKINETYLKKLFDCLSQYYSLFFCTLFSSYMIKYQIFKWKWFYFHLQIMHQSFQIQKIYLQSDIVEMYRISWNTFHWNECPSLRILE